MKLKTINSLVSFKGFLFLSVLGHLGVLGISRFQPVPAQLAVEQSELSIEITFEKEVPVVPLEEEVIQEPFPILEELKEEENIEQVKMPEALPVPAPAPLLQGAATTAEPIQGPVNPSPKYPDVARRRGWEGTVTLKVYVRQTGVVENVQVEQSSGYQILDLAAQNTVKVWKFIPARTGEINLDSWVTIPIQFRLIDQSP